MHPWGDKGARKIGEQQIASTNVKLQPSQASTLDAGAVPAPPAGGGVGAARGPAARPPDAQQGRDEPADGRQESKGLVGLEGAAVVAAQADAAPVEGVAAAAAEPVHEQAEDGEPGERDDEVDGPVDEAAGEGEQPEERQQDGNAGDDLGVDEPAQGPGRLPSAGVQVVSGDTCDDGSKGQLWGESACMSQCGLGGLQ